VSRFILDTDTLSLLERRNARVVANVASHPPSDVAVNVITIEEDLSGW
jgi:tRNA(fMet)-specific endonuclease VapC